MIGRFYSNDPVGFGADNPMMFNRYAYANNNPYKYVDPDGADCTFLGGDKVIGVNGGAIVANEVGKSVEYKYNDGSVVTKSGGSRAWRNNNPGNMRAGGASVIGKAGGFAVFSSPKAGGDAMIATFKGDKFQSKTVGDTIKTWAPASDGNDPIGYSDAVTKISGLNLNTKISDLNDEQLCALGKVIEKLEGWKDGESKTMGSKK